MTVTLRKGLKYKHIETNRLKTRAVVNTIFK